MLSGMFVVVITSSILVSLISSEVNSEVHIIDDFDFAVILGAGLNGEAVSSRLKLSLDEALELLSDTSIPIIVSGGQGPDEKISEAEAMSRYLVDNGIESYRIIIEDQSTSTRENIYFSDRLMNLEDVNVVIITSDYHMYRSKMLGERIGWTVSGQSAVNPLYTRSKRMVREVLALLKDIVVNRL